MTRPRAWRGSLQDISLYYRLVKMLQFFFHWSWLLYVVVYLNEYVCKIYLVLDLRSFFVRWFRCSCRELWWEEPRACRWTFGKTLPVSTYQRRLDRPTLDAVCWISYGDHRSLENLKSSHYFPAISDGASWQSFTDRRGLYDSLATSRLFRHILLHLRSLLKKLMIDGCSLVSTLHL